MLRELARKIDAFQERFGRGVSWIMLLMVLVVRSIIQPETDPVRELDVEDDPDWPVGYRPRHSSTPSTRGYKALVLASSPVSTVKASPPINPPNSGAPTCPGICRNSSTPSPTRWRPAARRAAAPPTAGSGCRRGRCRWTRPTTC